MSLDLAAMMGRKAQVVRTLTQGVAGLLRKNHVRWLPGRGRLLGDMQVEITPASTGAKVGMVVSATHIIVATGSVPATLRGIEIDNDRICDSTGALAFTEVPRRLGIIGAGVIGLELGSVWRRLGSEVVVWETLERFLPQADTEVAGAALKEFGRQGLQIRLGSEVKTVSQSPEGVRINVASGGREEALVVDKLIVAAGRQPCIEGLGAAECGLRLEERGFIAVDEECRTNIPNVYAIGDVVRGPMLAHKASEEGIAVTERIAGQAARVNYGHIPWVIYTWPEIAWAGSSEQALAAEGREYRCGRFPFLASGRARALGETSGFVKLLSDARSDQLLGAHIFGPQASELIAEVVVAMALGASGEDLARTVHAHPTLTEAIHEAALALDARAIHY
jgi:dihydrolipoamide dehydrogenase